MKWHLLISSVLLVSFVVVTSVPVDSTALGARDVQQSLKIVHGDALQPLSVPSEQASFDKALKSIDDELLVGKKKSKKSKAKKSKKKKKPKTKNKGKKGKASPAKTKKQKKK